MNAPDFAGVAFQAKCHKKTIATLIISASDRQRVQLKAQLVETLSIFYNFRAASLLLVDRSIFLLVFGLDLL